MYVSFSFIASKRERNVPKKEKNAVFLQCFALHDQMAVVEKCKSIFQLFKRSYRGSAAQFATAYAVLIATNCRTSRPSRNEQPMSAKQLQKQVLFERSEFTCFRLSRYIWLANTVRVGASLVLSCRYKKVHAKK